MIIVLANTLLKRTRNNEENVYIRILFSATHNLCSVMVLLGLLPSRQAQHRSEHTAVGVGGGGEMIRREFIKLAISTVCGMSKVAALINTVEPEVECFRPKRKLTGQEAIAEWMREQMDNDLIEAIKGLAA